MATFSTHLPAATTFTSWIQGRVVCDSQGRRMGVLKDFLVEPVGTSLEIRALVLKDARGFFLVPGDALTGIDSPLYLRAEASDYPHAAVPEEDIHLVRDVLDAQLIDTQGAKVVRVNDVQLNWLGNRLVVSGVDIGPWGLARRLGLANLLAWAASTFRMKVPEGLVPWTEVVPMDKGFHHLRLQVPSQEIRRLHPADLAEIVAELGHNEQQHLLSELSVEQIADVVENSEMRVQVSLLQGMEDERAADVLDAMEPDEAADVLGELPDEEAQALMTLMAPERAIQVRNLLAYPEETAGAMMTTGFIAVDADLTVGEAMRTAQPLLPNAEVVAYFYLVDAESTLTGVVSIRRILLAEPTARMRDLASKQLYRADVEASRDDVTELITRYKLTALPVVDEHERLVGVVSVNDVLEGLQAEHR